MTSYPGRHYDLIPWDAIMTYTLGRHYDIISWDAIMMYPGTPL